VTTPESPLSIEPDAAAASGSSSSLDPLETKVTARPGWATRDLHDPLVATKAQRALHARHWRERERLIRVLLEAPDEQLQKRALRLDGCCQRPQIHAAPDGQVKLQLRCCRDRLCPRCQHARGRELALRVKALITSMNAPRFLTLTLKHRPETLRKNHDRLMAGWKALRKTHLIKRNVVGGVFVVEVTRNTETNRWHTHLHIVIDGGFIPQAPLSKEWKNCTGDSEIVDIRAVHDRGKVAKYVSDYVAKPQALNTWESAAVLEFAEHMHGRRMMATFGRLHAVNIDPHTPAEPQTVRTFLCDTVTLRNRADAGNERAKKACTILCKLGPSWKMSLGIMPEASDMDGYTLTPEELTTIELACGRQIDLTATNVFERLPALYDSA